MMFNLTVDKQMSLCTFHPNDAEALFRLLEQNRARLRPWMDPSALPETAKATRIFTIARYFGSLDPLTAIHSPHFEEVGHYFPPADPPMKMGLWVGDNLAGDVTLSLLKDSQAAAEFGYLITEQQEGKGIILRCIHSLMDYAIDKLKIERFVIGCALNNQRSRAVAERLGYHLPTTIPHGEVVGEFIYDRVVYGIGSTAWRERKKADVTT